MRRPDSLPRDRSHYAGQQLLGFTRASPGGIMAFDADGKVIGTFATEKAAAAALSSIERSGGAVAS